MPVSSRSARSKGQPLSVWWRRLERSRGMGGGGGAEVRSKGKQALATEKKQLCAVCC
jgi:hypothetical protein